MRTTPANPLGLWHYIENDANPVAAPDPNGVKLYDTSGRDCRAWTPGAAGDRCELTNVAGANADIVAALHATLQVYVTNVDLRVP